MSGLITQQAPTIWMPGADRLERYKNDPALVERITEYLAKVVNESFEFDGKEELQITEAEWKRRFEIVNDWFGRLSYDNDWPLRRVNSSLPQILRNVLDGKDPYWEVDLNDELYASRPGVITE